MSYRNSRGTYSFERGFPTELKYDEIVLHQTDKCYRIPGSNRLCKYYEPVIVELSRSCHCMYAAASSQAMLASTPVPDGC